MPFQKGHKLSRGNKGGGRKGYEFEAQQLKRMNKILNKILTLVENILDSKDAANLGFKDRIKFEDLQRFALKIMDKLHPNRQHIEGEITGVLPFIIKIVKDDPKDKRKDS